jgi:hypothetical protein
MRLLTAAAILLTAAITLTLIFYPQPPQTEIQTVGELKVYLNPQEPPAANLQWGALTPGETKLVPVYIQNTGNTPLSITVLPSEWNPTDAATYLTLTCNCVEVPAYSLNEAYFALIVSPDIKGVGAFSFTITVTGSS